MSNSFFFLHLCDYTPSVAKLGLCLGIIFSKNFNFEHVGAYPRPKRFFGWLPEQSVNVGQCSVWSVCRQRGQQQQQQQQQHSFKESRCCLNALPGSTAPPPSHPTRMISVSMKAIWYRMIHDRLQIYRAGAGSGWSLRTCCTLWTLNFGIDSNFYSLPSFSECDNREVKRNYFWETFFLFSALQIPTLEVTSQVYRLRKKTKLKTDTRQQELNRCWDGMWCVALHSAPESRPGPV